MESVPSAEIYPKDKFHSTLHEVANHRFVTEDTKEYRKGMEEWMKDLKEGFAVLGVTECLFIPTGSVAVGMVSKESGSDIDGKVLYKGLEDSTAVNEFINKVELPEQFNPFLVFSDITFTIDRISDDSKHAVVYNSLNLIDDEAKLFAPTLAEFSDPGESKIIDGWRKEVIQRLSVLPDGQGETAWNMMRQVLERQFVHYETSDGGDPEKRVKRVEKVLSEKIAEDYPDDERKQQIAKNVIAGERGRFHYPTFTEMKEIFNIKTDKKESLPNKNVEFYENYLNEPDPDKRLSLAMDFVTKDAGDIWLYLYSSLSQEVSKNVEKKDAGVETLSNYVESEKAAGEDNTYVKDLTKYIELSKQLYHFTQSFENPDSALADGTKKLFLDEMTRSSESAWQEFTKSLDVNADPDLLAWLKNMIDTRRIIVNNKSDMNDSLQAMLAYAKTDHLVINPLLIPSRYTGADFLLGLSHERGHFFKNHSDVDTSSFKQGDLVLDEFFAMMEEQREFAISSTSFKGSVRDRQIFETPVDSKQATAGDTLPNSNITPKFIPGRMAYVLFEAYSHSLNQLTKGQQIKVVGEMLAESKSLEEIKEELKKMGKPRPSLLNFEDANWKYVDK